MDKLALVLSICSFFGYLITFYTFIHNLKKERLEREEKEKREREEREAKRREEAQARKLWEQKVETQLEEIKEKQKEQGEQIKEHNNYADLWHKSSEDIAYIKGTLEQLVRVINN